jgi:hypothetical protein
MSIHGSAGLSNLRPGARRTNIRISLAAAALVFLSPVSMAQTVVPSDANAACSLTTVEFSNWFTSGMVTANGEVDPANSIAFPNIPNCSFYKWSEQMFLWLTSPAPTKYGSGSHVFNSPVFYDLSPVDATNGTRTLVPIAPGQLRNLGVSISQLGPEHKPVVFDQTGKMFNVVRPERGPDGKPVVLNKAEQPVEIDRIQPGSGGKPILLDKAGKAIDFKAARNGGPAVRDSAGKVLNLRLSKTLLNGRPFFIDQNGNAVPTEQGQADGNVLMAQNGSLVYYALQVNDVFAYFLTGQKDGPISATTFPTTPAALNSIEAFGLAHSKTFPDANALAIELKSAWIEAAGLDTSKYVTITATIPTYDKVSPTQWNANGTRQAQLALVGLHVVGSTAGHPEMVWATFEHVNNARGEQYSYTNNATPGVTVTIPQNNAGSWTFSTTPPSANQNKPLLKMSGPNIVAAAPPTPIGPSDVLRVNPWGMPGSSTASNTEVVSINNSVMSQLAAGDIRKNYIMTGATWTIFGAPPNNNNQVGTNRLANTTMETFFQASNCFSCHQGNLPNGMPNMLGTLFGPPPTPPVGVGLSHVYGPVKPLFP